jgi:hypothetical protein
LTNFEELLKSVNFKKFDKETLTKLGKKSKDKWLQKNNAYLTVIMEKNSDDEGKDSNSDSENSDSESESESEESEDEESGGLPVFDKKFCSSTLIIDKKKKYKIKFTGNGWAGTALATKKHPKFAIKLGNNVSYLMVNNNNNKKAWLCTQNNKLEW